MIPEHWQVQPQNKPKRKKEGTEMACNPGFGQMNICAYSEPAPGCLPHQLLGKDPEGPTETRTVPALGPTAPGVSRLLVAQQEPFLDPSLVLFQHLTPVTAPQAEEADGVTEKGVLHFAV